MRSPTGLLRDFDGPVRRNAGSSLYLFAQGGYFGYFNRRFEVVIPARFPAFLKDDIGIRCRRFSEGFAGVRMSGAGRAVLQEWLDELLAVGLAPEFHPESWGGSTFLDSKGLPISNVLYEAVEDFHEGRAGVMQQRKWGYIDTKGSRVIPCAFDDVQRFTEGLACARTEALGTGFIDTEGCWAIAPRFNDGLPFSEGLAAVEVGGLWGFVDRDGHAIVPPRFPRVKSFSDGLAAVNVGQDLRNNARGLWGYIDRSGTFVIEPKFHSVGHFQDGLAFANPTPEPPPCNDSNPWPDYLRLKRECMYGLIDRRGQFVAPPRFYYHHHFSEGLASVTMASRKPPHWKFGSLNTPWGVIDVRGNVVIEPDYTQIGPFVDGLAEASTEHSEFCLVEDDTYYIDTAGKIAWPVGASEMKE